MSSSKEMRVGIFVLAGLVVAGIVVFLIGEEKRFFEKKLDYHTSFSDVQGLKSGAPVRLGGVDIGNVISVRHGDDSSDNRLYVDMHIAKREAVRVRQDTIAKIANKGLLGDKMIELSGGSAGAAAVPDGGSIQGEDPADFTNLFSQVGNMAKHADEILTNLEATSKALANTQMQEDLRGSVHAVNVILRQVSEGNGYAHRLIADPTEADRVSHLVATFDRAASAAEGTMSEAQKAVARVNQGPGFAHELLYGERGSDPIANLGGVSTELATPPRGIRGATG